MEQLRKWLRNSRGCCRKKIQTMTIGFQSEITPMNHAEMHTEGTPMNHAKTQTEGTPINHAETQTKGIPINHAEIPPKDIPNDFMGIQTEINPSVVTLEVARQQSY